MRSSVVVVSARDPIPRKRLGENKPEERRGLILERLRAAGCAIVEVPPADDAVLTSAVELGVISGTRLDVMRRMAAHFHADPHFRDAGFVSSDTADGTGVVPYFFVHQPTAETDPMERRLAWHATDALTPLFEDFSEVLADDAAVCERAAQLVADGTDAYALTTHPGHHASQEHFGGYCFVNHAVFIARTLRERKRMRPFVIDVDYHGGDGTASLLVADPSVASSKGMAADGRGESSAVGFVSLHAPNDYPFLPRGLEWVVEVSPGATWASYEPLLREALSRKPAECDCLVVSLGYDTLKGDPDAREGHRLALIPSDFAKMSAVLREAGLPMCVIQEGGYNLEDIPSAAEAFWGCAEVGADADDTSPSKKASR